MKIEIRTCPMCGRQYEDYPAISRKDNETEICPVCGMREALEAWFDNERSKNNDSCEVEAGI